MKTSLAMMAIFGAGVLVTVAPSASAMTVEYSTTGIFSVSGTNTATFVTNGGSGFQDNVTYTGAKNVTVNASFAPTTASFGNFMVLDLRGTATTGSGNFTLKVTQTTPSGSGSFPAAVFSGTISRVGQTAENFTGELVLTFSNPTLDISGVQYKIDGLGKGGLAANQLGLGLYLNPVNVDISLPTPEPGFMLLTGVGFGLLAFTAFRRRVRV